ncbi:hypothetical protein BDF21DRAFT_415520 [Thamnidium elegans]|uniref:Uncharacterized protein n=1 Tax=Thamnidium elegans TaxID=101142 RepID=A0A8H7SSF8_9FUNG|nr:hypothetical protein INT48_002856 [Thamnidium elegans]KAI8085574.1 hypothetical protein BDF21DRAFT_415520 [Thamnidium elegans]
MYAKQAITDVTKAYRSTIVSSVATSSFEVTAKRSMSAFSHMSDNDPNVLEKEKKKSLNSKDKEWNEKLASHSEAAVKADKEHDKPVKNLQEETIKHLEKKDKDDK